MKWALGSFVFFGVLSLSLSLSLSLPKLPKPTLESFPKDWTLETQRITKWIGHTHHVTISYVGVCCCCYTSVASWMTSSVRVVVVVGGCAIHPSPIGSFTIVMEQLCVFVFFHKSLGFVMFQRVSKINLQSLLLNMIVTKPPPLEPPLRACGAC